MSEAFYNSLFKKWTEFLDETDQIVLADKITEDDADEQYDLLVSLFCSKYNYKERTKNMAFYDVWYDTFADEYYGKLEDKRIEIEHEENDLPKV